MFNDETLKAYIQSSSTINTDSLVIAEWNLNIPDNIFMLGNYRYRPSENTSNFVLNTSKYAVLNTSFDPNDVGYYYTNATNADTVVDGVIKDDNQPSAFLAPKDKEKLLFSLEDCLGRFRPRSGINKVRFFDQKYIHHSNVNMAQRPRYYLADKTDRFKYWSSYRQEPTYKYQYSETNIGYGTEPTFLNNNVVQNGELTSRVVERGIANYSFNNRNYIDDAAPFVVYKESIPANRIVVKMQTNIGSVNLGPFVTNNGSINDPLYGRENATIPIRWRIQYLRNNTWVDAAAFDETSVRDDGSEIISNDGYVELEYGLIVPEQYKENFTHIKEIISEYFLPDSAEEGFAYLVKSSPNSRGIYYVWKNGSFENNTFIPDYNWKLASSDITNNTSFATNLTSPFSYVDSTTGQTKYKEFEYVRGIRIVVETMNKANSIFDLIEFSPRLAVNLTDKVESVSVVKQASDLGLSGMPVGQLLAGTGSVTIFDNDLAFNQFNDQSIISKYLSQHIQFKIYDIIKNVNGYNYYIPQKTLYLEGFPELSLTDRSASLTLRDLFFYFETNNAPQIFLQNVSLSFAIATLLDNIGFSNYVFKRLDSESDPTIPFFFIPPETSVAQILEQLAVSTQTAMFFDEYNNFVCMSKNYIMPTEEQRPTDVVLYGSRDSYKTGVYQNATLTPSQIANIVSIDSQENAVFNDGKVLYNTRYIQKSYGKYRQASLIDKEKQWIYKPALLWEVAPNENVRSQNDQNKSQSAYNLAAIPLNSDLSSAVPRIVNNQIVNNTMDLGEGVYWLSRYNGYFYSNGEIIKFDAVEYSIPGLPTSISETGNVWISSVQEYQNYFSKVPFNGKIYPTGLVRIYSEPNYEIVNGLTRFKNGAVAKHGRGQFGTKVVSHSAGISDYWLDTANVRGCKMSTEYLFNKEIYSGTYQTTAAGTSGLQLAQRSTRNSLIKNFLSSSDGTETGTNRLYSSQSGTLQSSALVFSNQYMLNPMNHVSYIYKEMDSKYKNFGTRMRIIGEQNNDLVNHQSPQGAMNLFKIQTATSEDTSFVGGSSGGIAVLLNKDTNVGYYYEIIALTSNTLQEYKKEGGIYNVIFYKVVAGADGENEAQVVRLYGGLTNILVDNGLFVGQQRMTAEENPTVYDLSVEYENIGNNTRRFYLYLNDQLIKTVDDTSPLPEYNNIALFIRGTSKCMFENVYALGPKYGDNSITPGNILSSKIFGVDSSANINDSFRKYAISGMVQSTYLSGISSSSSPEYSIYFDEFGSIMREVSYFNIRYDKAYPALFSKLSPTFTKVKGYTVSGFVPTAYGAEFLIFNATDTALNLDDTSGNYLRIQGVTFTQESNHELSVDDYFSKQTDFSNPITQNNSIVSSPIKNDLLYNDIKNSRATYGRNEFSIDAPYIQSQDDANELMGWVISKIMKPRLSVGVELFGLTTLQLGDIVSIDYKDSDQNDIINSQSRFVIYHIEYNKSLSGPSIKAYLSEVV